MSETTTTQVPETELAETPEQGALKKFAKAFAAKVRKAAAAVKAAFVRNVGDNETPVSSDEGAFRKALRFVTAVPKWIGHGILFVLRSVIFALWLVVLMIAVIIVSIAASIVTAAWTLTMAVYKVFQFLALLLRTPYLVVRAKGALKDEYIGYAKLWLPKYFYFTRIQQVYFSEAQAAKAKAEAAKDAADDVVVGVTIAQVADLAEKHGVEMEVVSVPVVIEQEQPKAAPKLVAHQGGKGHPTPKQRKRRPARIPAEALAEA